MTSSSLARPSKAEDQLAQHEVFLFPFFFFWNSLLCRGGIDWQALCGTSVVGTDVLESGRRDRRGLFRPGTTRYSLGPPGVIWLSPFYVCFPFYLLKLLIKNHTYTGYVVIGVG